MNILMVGELCNYGGATGIMKNLAAELKERGHKITLVYGYNYSNSAIDKDQYVIFSNKYIYIFNFFLRFLVEKYNLSNIYARKYITRLIKMKKIDIVHFNAMQGGFLSAKDIENLCRKFHVVWTLHDTWTLTGGCMCYWNCEEWKRGCRIQCNEPNLQVKFRNVEKNWNRKMKAITNKGIYFVAPSKWMCRNVQESFIQKERYVLIENGIDIELFHPLKNIEQLKKQMGVNPEKKVLMFMAGNIRDEFKGWNYMVSALRKLEDLESYILLLVGGKAEDIEGIEADVKKIEFVQEKKKLNELYNIADVFVLPSVQDNFPTVSLEAMAAGTPVVAFPVGGIVEQITEDVGWIVPKISIDCLADTINKIFGLTNYREEIAHKGKAARKRSEELYSKKLMAKKYEIVYKYLLNDK